MLRQIGIGQFGSFDFSVARSVTLVPDGGGGEPPPTYERTAFFSTSPGTAPSELNNPAGPYLSIVDALTALSGLSPAPSSENPVTVYCMVDQIGTGGSMSILPIVSGVIFRGYSGVRDLTEHKLIIESDFENIDITLHDISFNAIELNPNETFAPNSGGIYRGIGTASVGFLLAEGANGLPGDAGSDDILAPSHGSGGETGEFPTDGTNGGDGGIAGGGAGANGTNGGFGRNIEVTGSLSGSFSVVGGDGGPGGVGGFASANGGNGGNGGDAIGPTESLGGNGGHGGNGGAADGGAGGSGGDGGNGGTITFTDYTGVETVFISGGDGGPGGSGGGSEANGGLGGSGGFGFGSASAGMAGSNGSGGTSNGGAGGTPGIDGSTGSVIYI